MCAAGNWNAEKTEGCCKQAITPAEDETVTSHVDHSGHTEVTAVLLPTLLHWIDEFEALCSLKRLKCVSLVSRCGLWSLQTPTVGRHLKEYAAFKEDESLSKCLRQATTRSRVRHQDRSASSLALTPRLTTVYVGLAAIPYRILISQKAKQRHLGKLF